MKEGVNDVKSINGSQGVRKILKVERNKNLIFLEGGADLFQRSNILSLDVLKIVSFGKLFVFIQRLFQISCSVRVRVCTTCSDVIAESILVSVVTVE